MKFKGLITFFLLPLASILCGQQIIIQPYLQNASPSSMTIMWEADDSGIGKVHWGSSPFSISDSISSTTIIGNGNSLIHTAIITGLEANSKYYYKVKMQNLNSSILYHFKTPSNPEDEKPTQLVAISDMQRDGSRPNKFEEIINEGIIEIVDSLIGSDLSDLEALLIPGDLVATGGSYSQWQDHFFNPSDSLTPFVPLYPVPGNHEYSGGGLPNFVKYFTMPDNGPAGLEDQVWYKDISNIRVIGLNSNTSNADKTIQLDWLESNLATLCSNDDIDFVFAELHHPFKSELWTPGESDFTGDVIEQLENFTKDCSKPSLHFFGHTHGYSRGQSQDHEHLWVNVATAGGAIDNWGEFPNADYPEFSKSQDEYGFVVVEVEAGDDPTLTLKRFGRGDQDIIENNVLRDQITLKKFEFPPSTPSNIYPSGQSIQSSCILLQASQFYGVEDIHQASHWQVSLSGDFVDSLVVEEWLQSENFYNEVNTQANDDLTDVSISQLPPNKTYHWRVRYRDQYLKWSGWSSPTTFDVIPSGTILTGNLILNNGAENGTSNWTGAIEALQNAECGSVPPFQGTFNFAVGGVCTNESALGFAEQSIDLSMFATDIDNDLLSIQLSGYMRNFGGSDVPEIYCEFYDGTTLLSTTPSISNANDTWTQISLFEEIPINTTSCRVILKGTRNAGTDNDSYFDELNLFISERFTCPSCIGNSNIDLDGDGFCSDVDCNDDDPLIFPGALEVCDRMDNNCDKSEDGGDTVIWTGNGLLPEWSDANNWNQSYIPLPCQHVIIPSGFNAELYNTSACLSLAIENGGTLLINTNSLLVVNSQNIVSVPSIDVYGRLEIDGKILVKGSSLEGVVMRSGGIIENMGKVILE